MSREDVHLFDAKSILFGFISGSFIAGGFTGLGIPAQIALFIIGLLVLGDILFTSQEQAYIATGVFSGLIGFVVNVAFSLSGFALYYMLIISAATAVIYILKYIKK